MALGGDQGGSVRIPSAYCGTVGHKPTHGLVPYTGAFPIENTLDHLGPITRTVRDAALHARRARRAGTGSTRASGRNTRRADFLTGLEAGAAGLRIAVVAEGFGIPGLSQPGVDEMRPRRHRARWRRPAPSVRRGQRARGTGTGCTCGT